MFLMPHGLQQSCVQEGMSTPDPAAGHCQAVPAQVAQRCSQHPRKHLHLPEQGARGCQLWAGAVFLPVAAFFVLLISVQALQGYTC